MTVSNDIFHVKIKLKDISKTTGQYMLHSMAEIKCFDFKHTKRSTEGSVRSPLDNSVNLISILVGFTQMIQNSH